MLRRGLVASLSQRQMVALHSRCKTTPCKVDQGRARAPTTGLGLQVPPVQTIVSSGVALLASDRGHETQNCGKNALCVALLKSHMSFMTNDIPARQRTRNPALSQPRRPEEKWSGIGQLPRDEARRIEAVRNWEISCVLIGANGALDPGHTDQVQSALDRLKNIDPQDSVESMLATFMLQTQGLATKAAHAAALDYDYPHLPAAHVDRYMRLSMVFLKQVEALAKHRNKEVRDSTAEPTNASEVD